MEIDKKGYEEIEIPQELSEMMAQVRSRERLRHARRKKVTGAVLAAAVLVLAGNTPPVYAALSEVPVLGNLVQIFHIGTGGTVTDGMNMTAAAEEDVIKINFALGSSEETEQAVHAPAYQAEKRTAPDRLVLTVHGVRGFDLEELLLEAADSPYIRDAYREIILDDSAVRVVLELEPDTDFEILEYEQPASLEIHLFSEEQESRDVWFIRSQAMEMTEELALTVEQLSMYEGAAAQTEDGKFVVQVGEFETQEEAEQRLEELKNQGVLDDTYLVDHCLSTERLQ